MKLGRCGPIALLSAIVALGGATSTLAATRDHAVAHRPKSYGCDINPNKGICKYGVSGIRVAGSPGAAIPPPVTTGGTGGTRTGKGGTGGKRTGKGSRNGGKTGNGSGSGSKTGSGGQGNGKNGGNGGNALGTATNGSSPIPVRGIPVTGFGGTAQDLGASPRASVAGAQPVVVGLAAPTGSQRILALPATGGGDPSQPGSPLPAFLAFGLALLGLGLRRLVARS